MVVLRGRTHYTQGVAAQRLGLHGPGVLYLYLRPTFAHLRNGYMKWGRLTRQAAWVNQSSANALLDTIRTISAYSSKRSTIEQSTVDCGTQNVIYRGHCDVRDAGTSN